MSRGYLSLNDFATKDLDLLAFAYSHFEDFENLARANNYAVIYLSTSLLLCQLDIAQNVL